MFANDTLKTHHLPLLEESLAFELNRYLKRGLGEAEWLSSCRRLALVPTATHLAGAESGNRLEQAVFNLKTAGLWPW